MSYQTFSSDNTGWLRILGEIGFDARQMGEIGGLAIAPVEAAEYAEHLRGPVRAERGIGAGEIGGREIRVGLAAQPRIIGQQMQFEPVRRPSLAHPATARRRHRRDDRARNPGNR